MKRTQHLTRVAAVIVCLSTLAFLIVGAIFHWAWAGFDKPLYDWMQLLIIPIVLALIAVWFNRIDKKNELAIAQKRADDEQARTQDNQRESALQSYFDRISELVLKENLDTSQPGDKVRTIARARTLTVLPLLDAARKGSIIQFLSESNLIEIINLREANLRGANLRGAELMNANLKGANLINADLSRADLMHANLVATHLSGAVLIAADLSNANLFLANLSGTALDGTDLSNANLSGAKLSEADLSNANLSGANLSNANLKEAVINQFSLDTASLTKEQIAGMQLISS